MIDERKSREAKEWLWRRVTNGHTTGRDDLQAFLDGWDINERSRLEVASHD